MTSSSAPPAAPASKPLRFTDAVRLHARRFNKHPLASALRLLSADQRITHPDDGIALLTEVGHATRATALFAATYVPAFLGMVYGFAIGSVPPIAVSAPAVLVPALVWLALRTPNPVVLEAADLNEVAKRVDCRPTCATAFVRRPGAGASSEPISLSGSLNSARRHDRERSSWAYAQVSGFPSTSATLDSRR